MKVHMTTQQAVAMLLYARAFADLTFECDTFLALWSSEEEGLRGSNAFANNQCDYCLPHDKELEFYINMDMMGMSWPAKKNGVGDPFPYHAWSGPDLNPDVQDRCNYNGFGPCPSQRNESTNGPENRWNIWRWV